MPRRTPPKNSMKVRPTVLNHRLRSAVVCSSRTPLLLQFVLSIPRLLDSSSFLLRAYTQSLPFALFLPVARSVSPVLNCRYHPAICLLRLHVLSLPYLESEVEFFVMLAQQYSSRVFIVQGRKKYYTAVYCCSALDRMPVPSAGT